MKAEGGVYALIMHLSTKQRIRVGQQVAFGRHTYRSGWYVYLGSAHQPGGVRARTDRHCRPLKDNKRGRWNVDFVGDYAVMQEIWFSHAPPERECDWSDTIQFAMKGSISPDTQQGFGSHNCRLRCRAHFFYFPTRPALAAFRACIQSVWPSHEPIYTEFVAPFCSGTNREDSVLASYERGRRYLERRRITAYDGLEAAPPSGPLTSFRQDRVGSRLVEVVADEIGIATSVLKADAKLAEAVDNIVTNCGPDAMTVMLHSEKPQTRDAILRLSRKSVERQQHRIDAVAQGRARSVAPQPDDGVPDTMTFSKVNNRLARALGLIVACRALIEKKRRLSAGVRAALHTTARESCTAAKELEKLLQSIKVKAALSRAAKPSVQRSLSLTDTKALSWHMSAAAALIAKNLRDIPASSYDLRPTVDELDVARHEIRRIQAECRQITRLLTRT